MSASGPYASAIESLRASLIDRSTGYRRVTMAIGITIACAVGLLVATDSRALILLLLLPVWVLAFIASDRISYARWRAGVLADWSSGALHLDILVSTLRQVPGLPPHTLEGVIGALPRGTAAAAPAAVRTALCAAQAAMSKVAVEMLAARAVMVMCLAGIAVGAAVLKSWPVAAGSAAAAVVAGIAPLGGHWRRLARVRRSVVDAGSATGLDYDASSGLIDALDTSGIPAFILRASRAAAPAA